jgi:hypothetical protein
MSLQPTVRTPRNPALGEHAKERRAKFENRLADTITRFAGVDGLRLPEHRLVRACGSRSLSRNIRSVSSR